MLFWPTPTPILFAIVLLANRATGQLEDCDLLQATCGDLLLNATQKFENYANLRTPELIALKGYPVENHRVTTEDGYILTMFRIPPRNTGSSGGGGENISRIPVLVYHGMLASSVQWLWQPNDKSLVFMLADAGFDVWLGNFRGTSYSQDHVSLNASSDIQYWDFSHHEMGFYDVPASINYITRVTSQPSLYYVGHSVGTLAFFTGLILRPELAPRIRTMFSLATSGHLSLSTNPVFRAQSVILAPYSTAAQVSTVSRGKFVPELLPQFGLKNLTTYCDQVALDCSVCQLFFGVLFGIDPCQTDFSQLPGVLAHLPDTTSVKAASHLAQILVANQFSQYDYGVANIMKYGQLNPPAYDWGKYSVPTVIYYGDNDNICTPPDVKRTAISLGSNVKELNRVDFILWTHMDSAIGKEAWSLIYQPILNIMTQGTYG